MRPSGEISQFEARPGTGTALASRRVRPSKMALAARISGCPVRMAGSRVSGSAALMTTRSARGSFRAQPVNRSRGRSNSGKPSRRQQSIAGRNLPSRKEGEIAGRFIRGYLTGEAGGGLVPAAAGGVKSRLVAGRVMFEGDGFATGLVVVVTGSAAGAEGAGAWDWFLIASFSAEVDEVFEWMFKYESTNTRTKNAA